MNAPIETRMVQQDDRKITVEIYPDLHPDDPNDWDSTGTFHVFETAQEFWRAAEDTFGRRAQAIIDRLVAGEAVRVLKTTYIGLERYRHSGDVYARCKQGCFPDRQWDVSPIVGWWESNGGADPERFDSCLETWNQYVGGDVYGVVLKDEEGEILESLWGVYGADGIDDCVSDLLKELESVV